MKRLTGDGVTKGTMSYSSADFDPSAVQVTPCLPPVLVLGFGRGSLFAAAETPAEGGGSSKKKRRVNGEALAEHWYILNILAFDMLRGGLIIESMFKDTSEMRRAMFLLSIFKLETTSLVDFLHRISFADPLCTASVYSH